MNIGYKLIFVLVFILIAGLSTTKAAEYYSNNDVSASPFVKEMAIKINKFTKDFTGGAFGPDAIGPFISMPGDTK